MIIRIANIRRYLRGVPLSGIELNARGSQHSHSHSTETVLKTDDRTRLGVENTRPDTATKRAKEREEGRKSRTEKK